MPPNTSLTHVTALFAALAATACSGGQSGAGLTGADGSQSELTASSAYMVQSGLGSNICLVPAGGVLGNGTALSLGDCNAAGAFTWTRPEADQKMLLDGNRCLDVVDGSTTNGALVQLWDCFDDNTNQRWSLAGNQIMWVGQNKCLDVTDGVATASVKLQIWDCDSSNKNQDFRFVAMQGAKAPSTSAAGVLAGNGNNIDPATSTGSAGNANTVANPNMAASPNAATPPAAPAPVVYPPAELTGLTTAWGRRSQLFTGVGNNQACITISGFPMASAVQGSVCGQDATQILTTDGSGHINYPSKNMTIGGQTFGRGSYCLTAADPARSGSRVAGLAPCNSGDSNQLWGRSGALWVSMSARTCLTLSDNTASNNPLTLAPCTTSPQQAWTLTPSK